MSCYIVCDQTSAYVGEVQGKPVVRIIMTKYDDSFAFVGVYIVDEEYTAKRYGRKMFNTALSNLTPSCTIGLISKGKKYTIGAAFKLNFMEHDLTFIFQQS